ncbi:amidase family protein [Limnobacter sp.]|uniref:amidase family protein n=1 Tax=Limnobacter sp. TaxID=2003368 RepID=UPI00374A2491
MNNLFKLIGLVLLIGLSACGSDDPASNSSITPSNGNPTDPTEVVVDDPSPGTEGPDVFVDKSLRPPAEFFELVEADMQMVHDTLAGRTKMRDGSTLTCEGLAKMYIERIFMHNDNPQPNGGLPISAVLSINPNALDIAKALDQKYIEDGGIGDRYLHCMPVLLKDNYDTVDFPSTSASFSMLGHQAGVDAPSVDGLRKAGALILGKAHQDEFAYFTTGFSGRTVLVTNPYNTQESSAGSSSGSGAALASNFAIGGTGSDTCQSIRHPSSVSGLVGIRPSIGVVSRKGIFPLSHIRNTGGPMTRSVRDSALMLTAMASIDPVDDPDTTLFPAEARPDTYLRFLDRDVYGVKGKKIGVLRSLGGNSTPAGTGEQGALIDTAVAKMESMGAEVYDVFLPSFVNRGGGSTHYDTNRYFFEFVRDGGKSPRKCLSSAFFATNADVLPSCAATEGILETLRVGPRTAGLVAVSASGDPGAKPTEAQLNAIVAERDYVTKVMNGELDALGEKQAMVLDSEGRPAQVVLDALVLSPGPSGGRTCDFGSTTQMGSIVVPVGFDSQAGTPRGMEIFVRRFDEGKGLGIAFDFEQATLHRRPPNIASSPVYANQTIGEFNSRAQMALMKAQFESPEDLPVETYIQALRDLTGL